MTRDVTIYRFHDQVAITPPHGPTFYLEVDEAHMLAFHLGQTAKSVATESFADSNLPRMEIETTGERA